MKNSKSKSSDFKIQNLKNFEYQNFFFTIIRVIYFFKSRNIKKQYIHKIYNSFFISTSYFSFFIIYCTYEKITLQKINFSNRVFFVIFFFWYLILSRFKIVKKRFFEKLTQILVFIFNQFTFIVKLFKIKITRFNYIVFIVDNFLTFMQIKFSIAQCFLTSYINYSINNILSIISKFQFRILSFVFLYRILIFCIEFSNKSIQKIFVKVVIFDKLINQFLFVIKRHVFSRKKQLTRNVARQCRY